VIASTDCSPTEHSIAQTPITAEIIQQRANVRNIRKVDLANIWWVK
jgi:hypothetical protein